MTLRRFLAALLLFATICGFAEPIARLEAGPQRKKGLPLFDPNGIPFTYGRYRVGEGTVELYFLRIKVDYPAPWTGFRCGENNWLKAVLGNELYVFGASEDPENPWYLLMLFSGDTGALCDFLTPFLERFNYFEKLLKDKDFVSFPAILEGAQ